MKKINIPIPFSNRFLLDEKKYKFLSTRLTKRKPELKCFLKSTHGYVSIYSLRNVNMNDLRKV